MNRTAPPIAPRRLGKNGAGVYASPSYLARRGRPRNLDDDRHTWVVHTAVARILKLRMDMVQFAVDDFLLLRDLLRDGAGVGILPSFVARSYLRDGLLEEVTPPGYPMASGELVLLYPSSGQTPKKVTAFRDFLADALRAGPW